MRELTTKEKKEIKRFVTTLCASYDKTYNCCPLLDDYGCYMLCQSFADNKLCRYFSESVLPANPELERVLTGGTKSDLKPCAICGKKFARTGRQAYCGDNCRQTAKKKSTAKSMKKYRQKTKGEE